MFAIEAWGRVLNLEIVILVAAGLAAIGGLYIQPAASQEARTQAVSEGWTVMLLWLIVWKVSLVLFDPAAVATDWRGLLYFSGGAKGMWLAAAVSLAYLIYKNGLQRAAGRMLLLLLGWTIVYQLALLVFSDGPWLRHALAILVTSLCWVATVRARDILPWNKFSTVVAAYAVIFMGVWYVELPQGSLAALTSNAPAADQIGVKAGYMAPDFELTDRDGQKVRLSDYRGRTVMLNFWASWCPPCKAEMPHLQKLYDQYEQQGVAVLAVNLTATETSASRAARYTKEHGFTFPVVFDTAGSVQEQYRIKGYPTSIFIDGAGRIVNRIPGALDYAGMKSILERIREA